MKRIEEITFPLVHKITADSCYNGLCFDEFLCCKEIKTNKGIWKHSFNLICTINLLGIGLSNQGLIDDSSIEEIADGGLFERPMAIFKAVIKIYDNGNIKIFLYDEEDNHLHIDHAYFFDLLNYAQRIVIHFIL